MGYSLDEQDNVTITKNILNLTGLANGAHNITVYATDTDGNTAKSETYTFTVAKEPTKTTWIKIILAVAITIIVAIPILLHYRKTQQKQA
jgi:hypothetical protein